MREYWQWRRCSAAGCECAVCPIDAKHNTVAFGELCADKRAGAANKYAYRATYRRADKRAGNPVAAAYRSGDHSDPNRAAFAHKPTIFRIANFPER